MKRFSGGFSQSRSHKIIINSGTWTKRGRLGRQFFQPILVTTDMESSVPCVGNIQNKSSASTGPLLFLVCGGEMLKTQHSIRQSKFVCPHVIGVLLTTTALLLKHHH